MRRHPQRGMTLVELLVSMAVMSIILVGLAGAFFNTTAQYQQWADRLGTASTGTALAASLQSDSHRLVPCDGMVNVLVQTFQMCQPDDRSHPAVLYSVSGHVPYVITRAEVGKSPAFMARGESSTQPEFWADCFDDGPRGSTVGGHIHVYHFRITDGDGASGNPNSENFSVYYVAPWRPGC
ncbi:MAG TPA: type II secretion system protein [Candidatus Dormibacteraeota bacterium]|nr:type II secretion system protein [Candidatus Dormibacteraeota bacterium]